MHGMKFKKEEKNRVSWGWNLVCTVTKNHKTIMKLHREDLSFIFTHSSTFIGDMPYLTININQQLNVTAYLWNYAMKSYIEGGGFILVSNWHGTLCNSVIKLCTEIGLAVWHLPFGFHRVSCLVSNLDQSATAAYGLQDRSPARSEIMLILERKGPHLETDFISRASMVPVQHSNPSHEPQIVSGFIGY